MSKDEIKILRLFQYFLHCTNTAFLLPISTSRSYYLNIRIGFKRIHKTTMTLQSRGRPFKSANLNNTSLTLQLLSYIFAHRVTYLIIVTTYESSIFISIGHTVIQNHRDSLVIGTLNSLGNGTHLIRRNNQQIYTFIYKLVDLLVLQHIIIIRRSKFHNNRIIEVFSHLQLIIEFIAPNILRALGYSDDIFLWMLHAANSK